MFSIHEQSQNEVFFERLERMKKNWALRINEYCELQQFLFLLFVNCCRIAIGKWILFFIAYIVRYLKNAVPKWISAPYGSSFSVSMVLRKSRLIWYKCRMTWTKQYPTTTGTNSEYEFEWFITFRLEWTDKLKVSLSHLPMVKFLIGIIGCMWAGSTFSLPHLCRWKYEISRIILFFDIRARKYSTITLVAELRFKYATLDWLDHRAVY